MSANNLVKLSTVHWPPYTDEDAPGGGFITEILTAAYAEVGYQIKVSFIPWGRAVKDTRAGLYHGVFPAYYSEERSRQFTLSDSIATGELGFFSRSNPLVSYEKLEDLKPYKIGVVRGYVNTDEFDQANYLEKSPANTDEQNLRKLLKGRIDLAVVDKLTGTSLINSKIPEAKGKLSYIQPPLQVRKLFILFSKAEGQPGNLASLFNQGLAKMKTTGLYDKILVKYSE